MFRLIPGPDFTFAADVALTVPGQAEPATLLWVFRHRGQRALAALVQRVRAEQVEDVQVLLEVAAGWGRAPDAPPDAPWRGPVQPDGNEVPFSAEALADLLDNYPAARLEVWNGYLQALAASRVGN